MTRRSYIETESAKEIFWTEDGISFHLSGSDSVFARREGDLLILQDGKELARVSPEDDRMLLDLDGFPVAIEETLYQSMMGG
jgi:hypothetical protein